MDRLNPTWQNKVQHLQKTLEANGISYRINGIDASDPTADIEFSDADDATSGCNQDTYTKYTSSSPSTSTGDQPERVVNVINYSDFESNGVPTDPIIFEQRNCNRATQTDHPSVDSDKYQFTRNSVDWVSLLERAKKDIVMVLDGHINRIRRKKLQNEKSAARSEIIQKIHVELDRKWTQIRNLLKELEKIS